MMLVPTYLKSSGIHGIGIYAAEPIKAGAKIWEHCDGFERLIKKEDLQNYPPHLQEFLDIYTYPYRMDSNFLVLEVDNGRFMNHSVSPNTDFTSLDSGYAKTDIVKDEEITSDYGEFMPGFILHP